MEKSILITGGTGFIGSHLGNYFISQSYKVFYTGERRGRSYENNIGGVSPSFDKMCIGYDFSKIDWSRLPEIDTVIHMAAITDTTMLDVEKMLKVNVENSTLLFDAAIDHGCKNIVYASSCSVYGDQNISLEEDMPRCPLNPYAVSKSLLDDIAGLYNEIPIVGLRFSNVYGPNEAHKKNAASMVSRIRWQMDGGAPVLFKWGEQQRDWVYYKDVVQAVSLAAQATKSGIYNVGSGNSESFNRIVEIWNKALDTNKVPVYIDNPFDGKYQSFTRVNIAKAREELHYNPVFNLEQGIMDWEC